MTKNKEEKYEIITQVEEAQGLSPELQNDLAVSFNPFFKKAQEWKKKAQGLTVKDSSETGKMAEARKARLELKSIRVEANKKRIQLKEEVLLKGRAIDGMFNVIKFLIKPIEDHLEEQEKFIERQEKARLDAAEAKRIEELSVYVEDVSVYNLREMSTEAFNELISSQKRLFEIKKKEEEEAEQKRIEAEKLAKEKERRLDKIDFIKGLIDKWELDISVNESELLEMDNEKFNKSMSEMTDRANSRIQEIRSENEKLRKEKEEAEKQAEKERRERELKEEAEKKKLEAERKKREEAERKLAEQKAEEERIAKEKLEAERQSKIAPDKDKLKRLSNDILNIEYPEVKSEEAEKVLNGVKDLMKKVRVYIAENIENL